MASIPKAEPPDTAAAETLEQRFRRLEANLAEEIGYLSSYSDIVQHPAFREIIGLGKAVVPLMLRDLEARHGSGFGPCPRSPERTPSRPETRGTSPG